MNCGFQWELRSRLGEGFGTIWGTVGHGGAGRDIRLVAGDYRTTVVYGRW